MRSSFIRTLPILPVVLLVGVAAWQAVRVETHNQSPWIGGGFAMFSYTDNSVHRPLVMSLPDGARVLFHVPPELDRRANRLRAAPTDDRVRQFAADLSAWMGMRVEVEVWRPVFDADRLELTAQLLARSSAEP